MIYHLLGKPVVARYGRWYRRLLPRRLTLTCNPPIYGWLWWNFSWSKQVW